MALSNYPEGQLIGSASKPWRIGKLLGKGACGSVHEIERHSATATKISTPLVKYVVKLAPLDNHTATKKGKKRKKTAMERNADLLLHENTLYRNVFNDLRGTYIPDVPIHGPPSITPPGFGEISGYRFFVMERMSAPLFHVAYTLRSKDQTSISLGDVGGVMIDCIEKIHEKRYIFVDVKPENFMLAATTTTNSSKGESSTKATELAKRIRIIDLGLVESYHDMSLCGHRENAYPNSQFAGTPLYASLNVLRGHTPSRRDDLESVLYILSEMILIMIETKTKTEDLLPWNHCKSDEDILKVKEREMEGDKKHSTLFQRIRQGGNDTAGKIMEDAFAIVLKLSYNEKPKYDQLKTLLKKLKVHPRGKKYNTNNSDKNIISVSNTSNNNNTRSSTKRKQEEQPKSKVFECKTNVIAMSQQQMNTIVKKNPPRRSKRIAADMETSSNNDTIDSASCENYFIDLSRTSNSDDEENSDHGNVKATSKEKPTKSSLKKETAGSIKLVFIDGPHKGESFILKDKLLLGRDPELSFKNGKGGTNPNEFYKIEKDTEASASHVSLVLHTKNRGTLNSVRVTDLNSTNGTYINGNLLPQGGYRQVFNGGKIEVGQSVIQVKKSRRD